MGIDTYGSIFKKYKETGIFDKNEIYPYVTEGIGEDFLPQNVDFNIIDLFEKVTDKDAAVMTRRIVQEEGIWVGNSSGAAIQGILQLGHHFTKDDVVVVVFVDHGIRYTGKMFNNEWMMKMGYLDKSGITAADLVGNKQGNLITVEGTTTVGAVAMMMQEHNFSQMPVTEDGRIVCAISESKIMQAVVADPALKNAAVKEIMQNAFPFADISTPVDALSKMITHETPAVLVKDFKVDKTYIITRYDIINALTA